MRKNAVSVSALAEISRPFQSALPICKTNALPKIVTTKVCQLSKLALDTWDSLSLHNTTRALFRAAGSLSVTCFIIKRCIQCRPWTAVDNCVVKHAGSLTNAAAVRSNSALVMWTQDWQKCKTSTCESAVQTERLPQYQVASLILLFQQYLPCSLRRRPWPYYLDFGLGAIARQSSCLSKLKSSSQPAFASLLRSQTFFQVLLCWAEYWRAQVVHREKLRARSLHSTWKSLQCKLVPSYIMNYANYSCVSSNWEVFVRELGRAPPDGAQLAGEPTKVHGTQIPSSQIQAARG